MLAAVPVAAACVTAAGASPKICRLATACAAREGSVSTATDGDPITGVVIDQKIPAPSQEKIASTAMVARRPAHGRARGVSEATSDIDSAMCDEVTIPNHQHGKSAYAMLA